MWLQLHLLLKQQIQLLTLLHVLEFDIILILSICANKMVVDDGIDLIYSVVKKSLVVVAVGSRFFWIPVVLKV